MTEFVLVEWGGGSGFQPYTPPGRSPAPTAFVAATERMIGYPVVQPEEPLGDPDRYPVWTLLGADVEGHGSHWCFAVQGRGGAFGRSGTCQFLFVPTHNHPAQVWRYAVTLVNPDGRLGLTPVRESPLRAPDPDDLMAPLTALHAGQRRIAVDGDPLDVAEKIAALVAVLPVEETRARVWSTFLLNEPVLDQRPVLAGHWPAALAAESTAAARVRRWLGEVAPVVEPPNGREGQALARLAEWGCTDRLLSDRYRSVPDMRTLVATLARDELDILPEDVPELVRRDPGQLRGDRGRRALRTWAEFHPSSAVPFMATNRIPGDLTGVVFDGLFAAHEAGGNPMSFPPTGPYTAAGWQARLAEAVRTRYPTHSALLAFAEQALFAPGRPMADPADRHAALPWLESVGITEDDLPTSVELVAETLRDDRPISVRQVAFLRGAKDVVGTLRTLVNELGVVRAATAATVIDVIDDGTALRDFVRYAALRGQQLDDVGGWVSDLLKLRPANQLAIVEGAFYRLRDAGQLTPELLALALSEYADQYPKNATTRDLLLEAAERLTPAPPPTLPPTQPPTLGWTAPRVPVDDVSVPVHASQGLARSRYPEAAVRAAQPGGHATLPAPAEPARESWHAVAPGAEVGPADELAPGLRLLIVLSTVVVVLIAVYELFFDRL